MHSWILLFIHHLAFFFFPEQITLKFNEENYEYNKSNTADCVFFHRRSRTSWRLVVFLTFLWAGWGSGEWWVNHFLIRKLIICAPGAHVHHNISAKASVKTPVWPESLQQPAHETVQPVKCWFHVTSVSNTGKWHRSFPFYKVCRLTALKNHTHSMCQMLHGHFLPWLKYLSVCTCLQTTPGCQTKTTHTRVDLLKMCLAWALCPRWH